jgi:hypothetical protein
MTMLPDNWADALDPIVREWFESGFARRTPLMPSLFNVMGSTRAYEEISGVGAIGVDMWSQWEQSGTVGVASFDQMYKTTFNHREFVVELPIKKTLLEDNMINLASIAFDNLGDSAAVKRESDAASVFNRAFSGSYLGADGVALCSNSHPMSPQKTGSTQDNNGVLALTKTNVATVREAMMAFTDDNGNKVAVTPDTILVPPSLQDEAIEITASALDPTSANNTINTQNGRFNVVTWHYLTDSNAWFMIDSALMKRSLYWFDRVPVSIVPKVEDKTVVANWIARMRYSFGWADFRWVYGNNPS